MSTVVASREVDMSGQDWMRQVRGHLMSMKDEADARGLSHVAEKLNEALDELAIPSEDQLLYSMMIYEMFGDGSNVGNVAIFPSNNIKRLITHDRCSPTYW